MSRPTRLPAPPVVPRIPAAKIRAGESLLYYGLMLPALRQNFHRIRYQQVGRLPTPTDGPLILYLNHSAWWDLYMTAFLDAAIMRRRFVSYGMMEEQQLERYRFFTWMGAFSVHRTDRPEAARSLAYISHLLREWPAQALYMFPQGQIVPNDQRPLRLYAGLARIVQQVGNVVLCPVALRYEFRAEERPEAFIRLGPIHRIRAAPTPPDEAPARIGALTTELTGRLTTSVDALREAVLRDDMRQFATLLRGRPGIDKMFDRFLKLVPGDRGQGTGDRGQGTGHR